MSNPLVTVGQALEDERLRQGLSLYALGKATELSASRVRSILTGDTPNPGILTVVAVLGGLGKTLSWLDRQMRMAG
ncbi:MAG TPA: helix-turn-helix domain-containing protein [Urbifossiella sp.]|nr:helix-turn-helix domain-containing protein [Urbifossiella sp.]